MHEMSVCESIIQLLEEQAGEQEFERITVLVLKIGEMAGIETEAIKFCFEIVAEGSVAEGAKLVIEPVPGEGWCIACEKNVPMPARYAECPDCHSGQLLMTGGDEMQIKQIEVE